MTVTYDTDHGIIYVAFSCTGTIIPTVLRRWDFWFLLLAHVAMAVAFRTGWLDEQFPDFGYVHTLWGMNWNDIKVIAAMTTFFEVFYTNQCFMRYVYLYGVGGKITGACYEFIIYMRLYCGKGGYAHTKLATRFVLVSIFLNFFEVHHGGAVSEAEWKTLLDHGLLMPSEKDMLVGLQTHQRSHVLLFWTADVSREGLIFAKAPHNPLKHIISPLVSLRSDQQNLLDTTTLPIPFQYYHLLNAMVLFNLFLSGYVMAISDSFFASVIYIMCSLIFMGMLELADELSDPFGDDDVDFPIMEWLEELLDGCHVLLHRQYKGAEHTWEDVVNMEAKRGKLSLAGPVET